MVPASLGKISGLDSLWLYNNELVDLPAELAGLTGLVQLFLFGNKFREVPDCVRGMKSLGVLHLDKNEITEVPEFICELPLLWQLDLDSNKIQNVPACLGDLPLKDLDLASNKITELPEEFSRLQSLLTLYVSDNKLRKLPDVLPSGIVEIKASQNLLNGVPSSVSTLANLKTLYLSGNRLPAGATVPDLSKLMMLRELRLSNMNLTALPALPSSLMSLFANGNLFATAAVCLPALKALTLNDNPHLTLVGPPPPFGTCLPALTSADLANTSLSSIEWLTGSSTLSDLDLTGTKHGMRVLDLVNAKTWNWLVGLNLAKSGINMDIGRALAKIYNTTLISLDLSGNNIEGELSISSARGAGIWDGKSLIRPFNLFILRMDGITITRMQDGFERFFSFLRVMSLRNAVLSNIQTPIDHQSWLHLETLDLKGATGLNNTVKIPSVAPETPREIENIHNISCPQHIAGGEISRYSILADPQAFGYQNCSCLYGWYGTPSLGCSECPNVPESERSITAECDNDTLVATSAWLTFNENTKAVMMIPCPSDSSVNPCNFTTLSRTIKTMSDWTSDSIFTVCSKGYKGRLCSECADSYFRSGRACFACSSRYFSWVTPVLGLMLLTALGVKTVSGGYASRSGLIRTLVLHTQLVAVLPEMSLRMSQTAGLFMKASTSGSGGLSLNGLECIHSLWNPFYGPFAQACMTPTIALLMGAFIAYLSKFSKRGKTASFRTRFRTASLYLWMMMLFGALQRLVAPLSCTSLGSSHSNHYISTALWIKCHGVQYELTRWIGASLAGLYTALTAGVMIYRLRPGTVGTSAISSFLRSPYKPDSYFWEAVQLARRLALVAASPISVGTSTAQPAIVSSVLILSLLAHTWRKPYVRPVDNVVESISLTLLLTSYMSGLIASNPRFSAHNALVSWIIFGANALFISLLTIVVLSRTAQWGFTKLLRLTDKIKRDHLFDSGAIEMDSKTTPLLAQIEN